MLTCLPRPSGASDAIPFERRASTREPITGSAMAAVRGEQRTALIPVSLTDVSASGLGLRSAQAIPEGSFLALHTDASGMPTCVGRVASVRRDGEQWRLGLHVQRRMAA